MRPARGLLLVRPVEPAETYAGGTVIVPEVARQRVTMWQCECVAVGELEDCPDKEDCPKLLKAFQAASCKGTHSHPTALGTGQWLLVKPRSYLDTGDPERKLWLVRQCDVLAILHE